MKTLTFILFTLSLVSASAFATETATKRVITGTPAKALYTALVQADLPVRDLESHPSVSIRNISCSIPVGGLYDDNVDRGSCTGIRGTASAVIIANALISAGVNAESGMSHYRPSAALVNCSVSGQ